MPGLLSPAFGLPPLRRVREEEWMDGPNVSGPELEKALRYIRRINTYLGYNRATRRRVLGWSPGWTRGEHLTFLDVATGSLDVPLDLSAAVTATGVRATLIGLDFHAQTIRRAAAMIPVQQPGSGPAAWEKGRFTVVQGDAMALPFADATVDYVLTSMFLHHLSEGQVVQTLREMWRVARRGVLAADLVRSRAALAGVWALSRCSSAMIRHDAMASVRQAFTESEILELARQAGWPEPRLERHRNHRFTLTAEKPR